MAHARHTRRSPTLPVFLARPLRMVPPPLHRAVAPQLLNFLFADPLVRGELDFLKGRIVRIRVNDVSMHLDLTVDPRQRLAAMPDVEQPDVSIEGSAFDFLQLAARREDPDTLFFNRRLRLGGDTELGLYLKNFLDALEPRGRLQAADRLLQHLADWVGPSSRR